MNDTNEYEDNSETLNRADIRMVLSDNAQQEGQGIETIQHKCWNIYKLIFHCKVIQVIPQKA